jgi:RNA polymerase sigma-70 factor (ECF subfamily)
MSQHKTLPAVRKLLEIMTFPGESALPDATLLERFAQTGDEQAFATLLHRYAPMVWRVCRRRLRDAQAAEDAFQATFLVLARRAGNIRKQEAVAAWLHGVAYRLSGKARRTRDRLEFTGTASEAKTDADPVADLTLRELREVIDEELQGLAEEHRAPLVLCYLEGKTRDEAAQLLGLPLGTLKSRLERGRALLRRRLLRRGLVVPAGLGILALAAQASSAAVPTGLVQMTRQAALAFAAGRSAGPFVSSSALQLARSILPAKGAFSLKLVGGLVLIGVLGSGVGALTEAPTGRAAADAPAPQAAQAKPAAPVEKATDAQKPLTWKEFEALRQRLARSDEKRRSEAIDAGLNWIAKRQLPDGHWSFDGTVRVGDNVGTAFALLPLLNAGHTHTAADDPYQKHVEKGLAFLVSHQEKDGALGRMMYDHALATIALCRAYALTRDPKLREPATRAVDYIIKAQDVGGGWRYNPNQAGDLSSTSYQLMALYNARLAGIAVPDKTRDAAVGFVDSCGNLKEGYRYVPAGGQTSPTMTAAGRLCRGHLREIEEPELRGARLAEGMPADGWSVYYVHWAAPLVHRLGGDPGKAWLAKALGVVMDRQDQGKSSAELKGSWEPDVPHCVGSRLMTTSLAIQALQVSHAGDLPFAVAARRPLSADELDRAWRDLDSMDPVAGRRTVWAIAASPEKGPGFLERHLPKEVPVADEKLVTRLLAELDDDNFATREKAHAALKQLGPSARAQLQRAADKPQMSLEARRRVEVILLALEKGAFADRRRYLRTVEALELIGTAEAARVLEKLAERSPDPEVRREAKAAARHLDKP